jgi:hypothetical protein
MCDRKISRRPPIPTHRPPIAKPHHRRTYDCDEYVECPTGPQGPQGPTGPRGCMGPPGPRGFSHPDPYAFIVAKFIAVKTSGDETEDTIPAGRIAFGWNHKSNNKLSPLPGTGTDAGSFVIRKTGFYKIAFELHPEHDIPSGSKFSIRVGTTVEGEETSITTSVPFFRKTWYVNLDEGDVLSIYTTSITYPVDKSFEIATAKVSLIDGW